MHFLYGRQDMTSLERAQENCFLLTNRLGGFSSLTAAFSASRNDHSLLMAALHPPGCRVQLVHRLSEQLEVEGQGHFLSTQEFADGGAPEEGYLWLSSFAVRDGCPVWRYQVSGVQVTRRCGMRQGANTVAVTYTVENDSRQPCTLRVRPALQMVPKGRDLPPEQTFLLESDRVISGDYTLYFASDGSLCQIPPRRRQLAYPRDRWDGRQDTGWTEECFQLEWTAQPGARAVWEIVFSAEPVDTDGQTVLREMEERLRALTQQGGFRDPVARQLAQSAAAFLVRRESTGGETILAGYPFFEDWGRDTMIALPGCVLATGQYAAAKSILRTFLAYERDGLVPNLFPDGGTEPRYNTVDAALLLINCIWLYYEKTGDVDFVREAYPVLERIISAYRRGTRHAISMDADGLIRAGAGLDQVTWMDVCVDGILPTPRHGKPVEVNAYWYNALCILQRLAPLAGADGEAYGALARRVRSSFCAQFWMEDRGYLKDVLSGTAADTQLRCNQIWAVSLPFSMLPPEQERSVVDAVFRALYTPCGLRTLDPADGEFHPVYRGPQRERDLAYHQGTVWPFPLGAFYLAWLKTRGNTPAAAEQVRTWLEALEPALREGCIGQLPEIYDGAHPGASKGCFAQAWSVGELLRVYEALEQILPAD